MLQLNNTLLIAGMLSLVIVLAGIVIVHTARNSTEFRATIDRSFTRQANVLLLQSAALNNELRAVVLAGPSVSRQALEADLHELVRASSATAAQAKFLENSTTSGHASSWLSQGLSDRAAAVGSLNQAVHSVLLLGAVTTSATSQLTQVPTQISQAGMVIGRARAGLKRGPAHATLTQSRWKQFAALMTPVGQATFLSRLATSPSLAAHHQLAIVTITVHPSALPLQSVGSNFVLLPTTSIEVGAVVGNSGNVTEVPVAVVMTLLPLGGGAPMQRTDHLALRPSTSAAVDHGGFAVAPGKRYQLIVSVLPPPGSSQTHSIVSTRTITIAHA